MRGSILQARRSKRPRRGRCSSSDDLPPASPAGVLAWRAGNAIRLQGCIPRPGCLVITEDGERMAAGPATCALELGPQVLCPETSLTLLSLPESGSSAHA